LLAGLAAPLQAELTDQQFTAFMDMDSAEFIKKATDAEAEGALAREDVIAFLDRIQLDAKQAKKFHIPHWKRLVVAVSPDLSPEIKTKWASQLPAALQPQLRSVWGIKSIAAMDKALTGQDSTEARILAAARDASVWQHWSARGMSSLVDALPQSEDSEALAATIAARAYEKCLSDAEKLDELPLKAVGGVGMTLGKHLDEAKRAACGQGLVARLVADGQWLAQTSPGALQNILLGVSRLDENAAGPLARKVLLEYPKLKELKISMVGELVVASAGASQEGKATATQTLETIRNSWLGDGALVSSHSVLSWANFLRQVDELIPNEQRSTWAKAIHDAVVGNAEAFESAGKEDIQGLSRQLVALGDERGLELRRDYLADLDLASLEPAKLVAVASELSRLGNAGAELRESIVAHVVDTFLVGGTATRRIPPAEWAKLTGRLQYDMTDDVRDLVAQRLASAFLAEDRVAQLTPVQIQHTLQAIAHVRPAAASQAAAGLLTSESTTLSSSKIADVIGVLPFLTAEDRATIEEKLTSLDNDWRNRQTQWQTSAQVAASFLAAHDRDRGRYWALRAYEEALGTQEARDGADLDTLHQVKGILSLAGLRGPGTTYMAFAQKLVDLAKAGQLGDVDERKVAALGGMIGTDDGRSLVLSEIRDANGMPRVALIHVLTGSHANRDGMPQWKHYLKSQLAQADDPDAKARWLLGLYNAARIEDYEPSPAMGRKYLDQALILATEPHLRLKLLTMQLDTLCAIGRGDAASSLVKSIEGQFADTAVQDDVTALHERIQKKTDDYFARRAEYRARNALSVQSSWEREIRRRLERSIRIGDAEGERRYRALLGQEVTR